jgi:hypothetical protein
MEKDRGRKRASLKMRRSATGILSFQNLHWAGAVKIRFLHDFFLGMPVAQRLRVANENTEAADGIE